MLQAISSLLSARAAATLMIATRCGKGGSTWGRATTFGE